MMKAQSGRFSNSCELCRSLSLRRAAHWARWNKMKLKSTGIYRREESKQGYHSKKLQYVYYAFYPLHLLILGCLRFV